MKKTLFLSALLGAVLAVPAMAVTYGGTIYTYTPGSDYNLHNATFTETTIVDGEYVLGASDKDWHHFSNSTNSVLRYTAGGTQTSSGVQFNSLTIGGVIVDEDSAITSLVDNGTRSFYIGKDGETSGSSINKSFTIKTTTGSITLRGTQEIAIANGQTLTLTARDGITLNENVAFTGTGSLKLDTTAVNVNITKETEKTEGNGFGAIVINHRIASGTVDASTVTTWKVNGTNDASLSYDSATGTLTGDSRTTTTYYVNESDTISTADLAQARALVINSATAASENGANLGNLTSITLNGSSSVLDLTGTAVSGNTIKNLMSGAQGEGLLKLQTTGATWFSLSAGSVLGANVDVAGAGIEIDAGSLTIGEGKTLTVHGKLQFEGGGTITVQGLLDTSGESDFVRLGHGVGGRAKGNVLVSGSGLLKTYAVHNVRADQDNTLTLTNGGSLQVTGATLLGGDYTAANDISVTVTDGKLIAEGNDWTLNHAVTIGAAQVLGANTVTMNDTVTFTEGATVTVGSADKAGHLTISGSFSGEDAAFVVNTGSTLTLNSDVAINGLTIGTGASVVANGTLTLSGAASYTGSASTRDVTSATLNGFETTETYATAISGTGSVTGDATWTLNGQAATLSNGVVSYTTQGTTYNIKESDSHDIHETAAILNLHNTASITDSTFTVTDYMDVKDNTVLTFSGTTVDANRIWLHNGSVVNLDENSTVSVDNLTIAGGTISASAVAEMGTYGNADFNAAAVLTGSDITANGTLVRGYTMNSGKLTITKANTTVNAHLSSEMNLVIEEDASAQFSATSLTIGALTLGADASITVNDHNGSLTTTNLEVTGAGATINANLVVNGGTITFADNATLTMGCSVSIGTTDTVTVVLTQEMVDAIAANGRYDLFTSVESATLNGSNIRFEGAEGVTLKDNDPYSLKWDGNKIYVTPEPATATLSLLALAGLMARRKRH